MHSFTHPFVDYLYKVTDLLPIEKHEKPPARIDLLPDQARRHETGIVQ